MVKRKGIVLHKEHDKDILEWFENLPPRSHSEYIRLALRSFMKEEKGEEKLEDNQNSYDSRFNELQKEINELKEYIGQKKEANSNDTNSNDSDYTTFPEGIKNNFGK